MRSFPDHILRLIALGLGGLTALAAAVALSCNSAPEQTAAPTATNDPLHAELARCRTLTSEELETDTTCQDAWTEHRRRFLGLPSEKPEKE